MNPDRWQQVERLYHAALARPAEERAVFLAEACAGDEALQREIESLLAHPATTERFLVTPAAQAVAGAGRPDAYPALDPGTTLGSYRIERLLGRGGMGAVFLAYDTRLHRQVALKVVGGRADGETSRTRLLREARNAAALNHPNICTVHEVGEANDAAFIAMEYVDGRSLRERLDEHVLPVEDAVRLGIQAADALAYAHDHGVIHRDLKAANVIVTGTGRVKIVDFGLGRRGDALMAAATTMASVVPAGAAAGTPYAMAPEQVRGDSTDGRTDIWALGVLLYEIVSGRRPFDGPTIPELFSSILGDVPAPLPNTVPVEMKVVIERCLQSEPAQRYQNAGEVRGALEAIQLGTVSPWAGVAYHVHRRRWLLGSAAVLLGIAAAVVGFNIGGARDRLAGRPPETVPIKLAVLPFENLTGDPDQEYFSDGLTDEMITQLGRLHPQRLSVIARTSSMRYKDRDVPVDQIGRELAVDYVLEGSARREGNRVRITATLIQVSDQSQRWTESFDRELAGMLALQSDVAGGVARSLSLALLPAEQARLAAARPVNLEAYEAYLKGRFHADKQTPQDLDTALGYFQLALQKDPMYAQAYAGIAWVWMGRNQMGYVPPSEAVPQVKAAALKAVELDSGLAIAHHALANAAWVEWDWQTTERESLRAIDIDPNYPDVRALYAFLLTVFGRPEEAVAQIQRALQLDPFNAFFQATYGLNLRVLRRYDEAVVQLQNALKTSPDLPFAHCGLWSTFRDLERYADAVTEARRCMAHYGREVADALSLGYAEAGYAGAMRRAAGTLAAGLPGTYVSPFDVASAYSQAGDRDRTLEWLAKALEARDPNTIAIVPDPQFDILRGDPRFQELVRRLNLPI